MPDRPRSLEGCAERRRVRWATFVAVGVGLVRGSAAVFVFVLVVMPLVILGMSGLGLM